MRNTRFILIAAALLAAGLLVLTGCATGEKKPGYVPVTKNDTGACPEGKFKITFTKAHFVTGLGWGIGSTSRTITWSGSCTGCNWGPAVYGWMRTPLVEYYIPRTDAGKKMGTYTADGKTYTLVVQKRVNQPSIEGTSTFDQYFASGSNDKSVNFGEHAAGWQSLGMPVGKQAYQVVAVESWSGGTGSAVVTVPDS
jgi:endo-1,4-beta-xylanase